MAFNGGDGVDGDTFMQNTIVAGNTSGTDVGGGGSRSGNNVDRQHHGLSTTLADNGGPTQTLALLQGSPAIAAGGSVTTVTSPSV